ncbi:hypothetical protein [Neisseria sp. Ec49-e6-T10]|uniref:hypothetical protein n=1 Tax=Neisseria sp. Ec49-e6-T10 TaxID=3140744 RepID=UPI003EC07482
MNKADQRITELEDRLNNLQSLSGGILKLLFLSLSYHTQNSSLTEEQKATIKEKITKLLENNEPVLLDIFMDEIQYAEELTEIIHTMDLP